MNGWLVQKDTFWEAGPRNFNESAIHFLGLTTSLVSLSKAQREDQPNALM
jgi:hypothetical protein